MEPLYRPINTFETDKLSEECKTPEKAIEIKINKLFISKKRDSLDLYDNELPRDSIEKIRERKDSVGKLRERKGSREIFIKTSPRTEVEFAKNS